MMNFRNLINIHFSTYIYFIVSLFTGYFKYYIGAYIIVIIHELCHLLMANFFHFSINHITFLPFGAYLSLDDFNNHSINEELCVVLAGPSCHFIIYFLLIQFHKYVFIQYLLIMNKYILIFNILPIYPMDGYRCLLLVLEKVCDLQKSYYITFKISILCLCLFICVCKHLNYYMIFIFLLYSHIHYYKSIPMILRNYYIKIPYHHHKSVIHSHLNYKRDVNNYYFINNRFYDEERMKYCLIKNIKRI